MRGLQKFVPFGGLDTDTDLVYIKEGNYRDALNSQHLTDSTGSTQAIIPMKGNTEAFDIGSISAQNKTYRIYTTVTAAPSTATMIFYQNGNQFGYPSAFWQTFFTVNWNQQQPLAAQASDITAAITAWAAQVQSTVSVGADYIDLTLTLVIGGDYTISITDTAGDVVESSVVQEAFDTNMAGELQPIGSYDLLGDLYVWSTTGTSLPVKANLTVSSVSLVVSGVVTTYQITFSSAHGLSAGQSVDLVGDIPTILDGSWIVSANGLTANSIVLETWCIQTALPAVNPATMLVTTYAQAVGEVGVAQYTASTDTWLYTRLARTKQWGFRTMKQPDTYCEQTSVKSSIYWTDDYNVPRCFYYIKEYNVNNVLQPFVQDGIITPINSTGIYTYETIDTESKLQITSAGSRVTFTEQLQSGGHVLSGNWRYAVRFLTEGLTATECTDLTNPINVCVAALDGDPALIIGDEPDTITSKINVLNVTGIVPGLFKYIELIGVNYIGNGVAGYKIKRIELSNTQDSISISHIGTETDTTDFDLGLLGQVFEEIATAKNIDVIDKRMILSNLTTRAKKDFTNWAQLFKHLLFQHTIDSVGTDGLSTLKLGEYQDPENVNLYVGYMQNETYRFGVKVKFKDGGYSEVFHIDDVIFDTENTNSASTDPTRRITGLPNFNLTDFTGAASPNHDTTSVYVPAIQFTNIDLDYKVDGVRVGDLIDSFSIERAEVTNPTILASGYGIPSIQEGNYDVNIGFAYGDNITYFPMLPNGVNNGIGEYPFFSGRVYAPYGGLANPLYDAAEFLPVGRDRTVLAFYSPDIRFGHTSISYASGDQLLNHGNPLYPNFYYENSNAGVNKGSQYAKYTGYFNTSGTSANVIMPLTVSSVAQATYGTDVTLTSGKVYRKRSLFLNNNTIYSINPIASSPVIECTTGASVFGTQSDRGFYYIQYYRPAVDQYGDVINTTYVSCGHYFDTTGLSGLQTTQVFGGDTFTQLNYFRHRNFAEFGDTFPGQIAPITALPGFGGGVAYYCQSRVNAQMKQKSASQTGNLYPGITTVSWLETTTNTDGSQGEAYQEGYTVRNEVKSDVAFNPDGTDTTDQPTRIRWSAIKPQGSAADQYRTYLPLDYHDLDQSFGEIVHHANANGELITWQQRAFMRQYFNTRGTLEVKGITEVLIGDGSVMSRDGVTVSRLGSKHKWAIIKGKSTGGNDVFYWINTELKKALRFGYDGTVSVSDIKGMQSFFANNLKWVDGYDTPANGTGISGVWDDRYANAVWVMRATRPVTAWDSLAIYSPGDAVSYTPSTYSTFNETGEIYISIDPNPNSGQTPDTTPAAWEIVPHTNNTYYNEYSIIFNEFKNAFTTFTTPLAKIFLKWTDTYLGPRPVSPEYKVYQFNKGDYLTWWEYNGVSQQEQGYIQFVVNEMSEETKWYEALAVDSEIVPTRFEFETKNHESFLTGAEFETREDSSYAPIKNDSTGTGINDNDTSSLYGKYMLAKMFFDVSVYQKLVNVITKFRVSPRFKTK